MHIGSTHQRLSSFERMLTPYSGRMQIPEFNINSMEVVAHVHEIIATIKELVKLDPLFKEQFVALLDRVRRRRSYRCDTVRLGLFDVLF